MTALTSAPVEIILYILQSCDSFTELRHVAPKVMPAFDWALLAVRATALVHDTHHQGRLAPQTKPEDLTDESQKPSLQELDSVFGLHHFVRCVELRYCHNHLTINKAFATEQAQNLWPEDRKPPPPINDNAPEDPGEGMRVWRERFHIAAYMSLLMGAVFARAYNAPFYPKEEDLDNTPLSSLSSSSGNGGSLEAEARRKELGDLMRQASSDRSSERYFRLTVKEDMREYLRQFPVYDLNDELGGQEKVFGPFIEWFIRVTISQYNSNKTIPKPATRDPSRPAIRVEIDRLYADRNCGRCPDLPGSAWMECHRDGTLLSELFDPGKFAGSPAEAEAVVWSAMQAVHMFEFIITYVTNLDRSYRFGRSSKVVLFGVFQTEEILMQVDVKSSTEQQLVAYFPPACACASASSPSPSPHSHGCEGYLCDNLNCLDIPLVFDDLYNRPGIANHKIGENDIGYNRPPPPLQLFMFLLEHHFHLEFDWGLFTTFRDGPQDYWPFKKRATIFAHGPELVPERNVLDYTNGMEFLVPLYPRPLSFCNLGDWYFDDDLHYHGNPRTWEPDYNAFEEGIRLGGW
ncbi:hypothetical protein B0T09DRAFT_399664 [Sordaria sp. MPI-SDFR-AT-0083]|nr:hypothetical protein B0T09DRAFT_399664 [Sordaria sp. MPI-SDFR-AT-0083]